MGFVEKLIAIPSFLLAILLVLEKLEVYSLDFGYDKVFIAAALMALLQIVSLIGLHYSNGHLTFANIVTAIIFFGFAGFAVYAQVFSFYQTEATILLGATLFAESLYALH